MTKQPHIPISESNDPNEWAREIQDCIAQANLDLAVKRLIDYVREYSKNPDLEDSVYLISMSYRGLENELLMDTVSSVEARKTRSQIGARILKTIRIVKQEIKGS